MDTRSRNKYKVCQALRDNYSMKELFAGSSKELRRKLKGIVSQMIEGQEKHLGDPQSFIKEVVELFCTFGPIAPEVLDSKVSEIMVVGPDKIYVEVAGTIKRLKALRFSNEKMLLHTIERIAELLGRRIDEESPMVDARLKDGSRVNAVIRPLAVDGPLLTIRKFNKELLSCEDLIRIGTLTRKIAQFLQLAVQSKLNLVVSGPTGAGKTTLLNILSAFIPEGERIVTIEDVAELSLHQEHVARMESRPATLDGPREISIGDLFKNSLRMRPDRIVVGECRGVEAFYMLQAMNTGHDGSMTTIHANTPRDVISRLENMVMMAGYELPLKAIRFQIASAIQLIIQIRRYSDGTRKISQITEITGMVNDVISQRDIFSFNQTGIDKKGRVIGSFVSPGFIPEFFHRLREQGLNPPMNMFHDLLAQDSEVDGKTPTQVTKRRQRFK